MAACCAQTARGVKAGGRRQAVTTGQLANQQNRGGRLKLLIRFGDALPVKKQLNFGTTARGVVEWHFPGDFDAALAQALKTAK